MGIPLKLNPCSGGKANVISERTPSKRSDASNSIVQEVFAFIKRNCPERREERSLNARKRGAERTARPVPASARSDPEREQRSALKA
jgi:hypothetical protein